ncbi:hypothetical protein LTR53_001480 [Teratosphaeriaceae sp. CCFEE 6253]|nr:hypothetical protein LTR53_001480 [Teratosphaeriaceae sp. CCFEE 6253]
MPASDRDQRIQHAGPDAGKRLVKDKAKNDDRRGDQPVLPPGQDDAEQLTWSPDEMCQHCAQDIMKGVLDLRREDCDFVSRRQRGHDHCTRCVAKRLRGRPRLQCSRAGRGPRAGRGRWSPETPPRTDTHRPRRADLIWGYAGSRAADSYRPERDGARASSSGLDARAIADVPISRLLPAKPGPEWQLLGAARTDSLMECDHLPPSPTTSGPGSSATSRSIAETPGNASSLPHPRPRPRSQETLDVERPSAGARIVELGADPNHHQSPSVEPVSASGTNARVTLETPSGIPPRTLHDTPNPECLTAEKDSACTATAPSDSRVSPQLSSRKSDWITRMHQEIEASNNQLIAEIKAESGKEIQDLKAGLSTIKSELSRTRVDLDEAQTENATLQLALAQMAEANATLTSRFGQSRKRSAGAVKEQEVKGEAEDGARRKRMRAEDLGL